MSKTSHTSNGALEDYGTLADGELAAVTGGMLMLSEAPNVTVNGRPMGFVAGPRATTPATSNSVWRQDTVGKAMPVACRDWEKALPDARWRARIRGTRERATAITSMAATPPR